MTISILAWDPRARRVQAAATSATAPDVLFPATHSMLALQGLSDPAARAAARHLAPALDAGESFGQISGMLHRACAPMDQRQYHLMDRYGRALQFTGPRVRDAAHARRAAGISVVGNDLRDARSVDRAFEHVQQCRAALQLRKNGDLAACVREGAELAARHEGWAHVVALSPTERASSSSSAGQGQPPGAPRPPHALDPRRRPMQTPQMTLSSHRPTRASSPAPPPRSP